MAEDSFMATAAGKFRGSRYPGFTSSGAQLDPATGVGISTGSLGGADTSGTAGRSSNSLMSQSFDTPTVEAPNLAGMAKGIGGMAAQGATQYATTKIGATAGQQLANGAANGVGDALGQGVKSLASDVSGAVGFGHGVSGTMGSVADVGPTMAEFTSGANSLGAQGLSEGASEAGSQVAGSAGSSIGSSAAAPAATSGIDAGISKLSDGANLGGAAGAGIGRAAIGLAMGEKPAAALRAGAGSAVGYYAGTAIGTAIGGPVGGAVGGFIGSTIGSIFCFAAGTPILMADGTTKPVEQLRRGDVTMLGGRVVARGESDAGDLYLYRGTVLVGGHAVFEDGRWLRVANSTMAVKVEGLDGVDVEVYPVATENRLLVTPWFIAADAEEVDNTAGAYTDEDRIDMLNGDAARNAMLARYEVSLCAMKGNNLLPVGAANAA